MDPLSAAHGFLLHGDLDVFTVDDIRKAIATEVHGTLVLDLAAVEYIDDSGLGLLLQTLRRLRDDGGSLVLRNPTGPVFRVLDVTGVAKIPGLTIE